MRRFRIAIGSLLVISAGLVFVWVYLVIQPIQRMPVYVMVPTNGAAISPVFGTNIISVQTPYADVTDKLVTERDIDQIRKAIPWTKTSGLFYRPWAIDVYSSNNVEATFYRGNKPTRVHLVRTNADWEVEYISTGGQDIYPPVPSLADKINQWLPF
jgi:hypothetical protein